LHAAGTTTGQWNPLAPSIMMRKVVSCWPCTPRVFLTSGVWIHRRPLENANTAYLDAKCDAAYGHAQYVRELAFIENPHEGATATIASKGYQIKRLPRAKIYVSRDALPSFQFGSCHSDGAGDSVPDACVVRVPFQRIRLPEPSREQDALQADTEQSPHRSGAEPPGQPAPGEPTNAGDKTLKGW
jgi:hypothetical protein